jgi:hypothetical protein
MSSDSDHDKDHGNGHDSHDGQAAATDIIPENSPQDLLLKIVTVAALVLISGSFIWWYGLPQTAEAGSEHGGAEQGQHQ